MNHHLPRRWFRGDNKIGLLNVHHRVKLLYGEGLHIRRLEPGTEIAFYVPNERLPVHTQTLLWP
ncbi:hypothetical protein E0D81_13195 [Lelliottia amnigena]|nr:hypothetical protein E0D81_13195 [Lelliottia amnigena]